MNGPVTQPLLPLPCPAIQTCDGCGSLSAKSSGWGTCQREQVAAPGCVQPSLIPLGGCFRRPWGHNLASRSALNISIRSAPIETCDTLLRARKKSAQHPHLNLPGRRAWEVFYCWQQYTRQAPRTNLVTSQVISHTRCSDGEY